jgi:hypothetical protein
MWAKLLRIAHGDKTLYRWALALRAHVVGGEWEGARSGARERRLPPQHKKTGERLDFARGLEYGTHPELVERAMRIAGDDRVPEPYAGVLTLLEDCRPVAGDIVLKRQEREGASYKTLAAAHAARMNRDQRVAFYRLAEKVPLSQRMAGHILSKLKAKPAA